MKTNDGFVIDDGMTCFIPSGTEIRKVVIEKKYNQLNINQYIYTANIDGDNIVINNPSYLFGSFENCKSMMIGQIKKSISMKLEELENLSQSCRKDMAKIIKLEALNESIHSELLHNPV